MLYVGKIQRFLLCSIISQAIPQRQPVNVMMVGESSIGATEMMSLFKIKGFKFTQELTGNSYYEYMKEVPDKTFMLAQSDFNRLISRRKSTSASILSTLLDGIYSGYSHVSQAGKTILDFDELQYLSMMSKMTNNIFIPLGSNFYDLGLLQRFFIIHFGYTSEQWEVIKDNSFIRRYDDKIRYTIPKLDNITVEWDNNEARDYLIPVAQKIERNTVYDLFDEKEMKYKRMHVGNVPRYSLMLMNFAVGIKVYNFIRDHKYKQSKKSYKLHIEKQDYLDVIDLASIIGNRKRLILTGEEEGINDKFIYRGEKQKW